MISIVFFSLNGNGRREREHLAWAFARGRTVGSDTVFTFHAALISTCDIIGELKFAYTTETSSDEEEEEHETKALETSRITRNRVTSSANYSK